CRPGIHDSPQLAGGPVGTLGDLARDRVAPLRGLADNASAAVSQLAPLRASLSTDLQRELDQLARTPEGLAALADELSAVGGEGRATDGASARQPESARDQLASD